MGNRAVVVFAAEHAAPGAANGRPVRVSVRTEYSHAIYHQWNGGPESVYAFLDDLDAANLDCGRVDWEEVEYACIVNQHFGGHGVYIHDRPKDEKDLLALSDGCDNGLYLVYNTWTGPRPPCRRHRRVRRFYADKEQSSRWVAKERREAYQHDYHQEPKSLPGILKARRELLAKLAADGPPPVLQSVPAEKKRLRRRLNAAEAGSLTQAQTQEQA